MPIVSQLRENMFSHHPNIPTNLNLQLQLELLQLKWLHIQHTPQSHSFVKITSSPTMMHQII